MLLLQILIVPVFGLTILGAVFMIGVAVTITPGQDAHDNQPTGLDN